MQASLLKTRLTGPIDVQLFVFLEAFHSINSAGFRVIGKAHYRGFG